ncbi:MAG: serine dehydratase subunit alpha family protein [Muribaculaceae bacterium]
MISQSQQQQIIDLIKREVVPAIGCTEPMAVALCVARATELLGCMPSRIEARLSANILKNAMGVGIPGTGMIGLPIAIALGASIGRSDYGLEVLKDCTPQAVAQGKEYIAQGKIDIKLKEGITEKLYIEVRVSGGNGSKALAIIAGGHTHFVYLVKDGKVMLDERVAGGQNDENSEPQLTMARVYEFATTTPISELRFILESSRLNMAAAEQSFQGHYGHQLGRIIRGSAVEKRVLGDNTFARIISYTSAACDARMAGAMIPVMSNSGSGNQGITATMPVVVFAKDNNCTEEQLIRALTLSHLTVIYIKQSLGRLSALCGCVVAASGSSCGITYLMGGSYEQICYAVKNMIANLTGMVCDGAKPSCALKVTSGVSTAVLSAILAIEGQCVTSVEGIVDNDIDQTIHNLTSIGREAMNETDRMVLHIMTHKSNC